MKTIILSFAALAMAVATSFAAGKTCADCCKDKCQQCCKGDCGSCCKK